MMLSVIHRRGVIYFLHMSAGHYNGLQAQRAGIILFFEATSMSDQSSVSHFRPIPAAVVAAVKQTPDEASRRRKPAGPFLTISREVGSDDPALYPLLVERLNAALPHERAWMYYDRELVEKVAADHALAAPLVATLGAESHSWLDDLRQGLSVYVGSEPVDEYAIYRRVAQTVRALAKNGRVILVGRGGVFIARDMPHGVHVRLLAPLEDRVAAYAKREGLSLEQARRRVTESDAAQESFYQRYWPKQAMAGESFTTTLNTSQLDTATLVEVIVGLVVGRAKKG